MNLKNHVNLTEELGQFSKASCNMISKIRDKRDVHKRRKQ